MMKSKNLQFKVERERRIDRKYMYPIVITNSGKIKDYKAMTVILTDEKFEELE